MASTGCRICAGRLEELVDLGAMPPANWLLDSPDSKQERYPLALDHCGACANLQLRYCLPADVLYGHYFYMTPTSSSLDQHYRWLIDVLFERGYAGPTSSVIEVGSNRGAFLKVMSPQVGSILGVDPAKNVVEVAIQDGVDTVCDFFDFDSATRIAEARGLADLIVARHCFAHNEWPQRMLEGAAALLPANGVLVIENNYAAQMIRDVEFDQIYHEHMFYYSLSSLSAMFERSGFRVIDVEVASVHGGSIVCFAVPMNSEREPHDRVAALLDAEMKHLSREALAHFAKRTYAIRDELRTVVAGIRDGGRRVAAYGATAKGATLMNFCGFTDTDVFACADSTPIKEGRYIPGTGIQIVAESSLLKEPPDFFLLTAWNYKNELIAKARSAGAAEVEFIIPIPNVEIVR